MTDIIIFGDSIAYGAWDEQGGWVQRLRNDIDNKVIKSHFAQYYLLYNQSIPGDTTTDLLDRIATELKNRTTPGEPLTIIYAIGTNDAQYNKTTTDNKTPSTLFQKNIEQLRIIAQQHNATTLFLGLPPVDEQKTNPKEYDTGTAYRTQDITAYNQRLKEHCMMQHITFIDINTTLTTTMLADGLHPNNEGHTKIYEQVKQTLEEQQLLPN